MDKETTEGIAITSVVMLFNACLPLAAYLADGGSFSVIILLTCVVISTLFSLLFTPLVVLEIAVLYCAVSLVRYLYKLVKVLCAHLKTIPVSLMQNKS
ncbi:MAG: hypothetical protein LBT81_05085 [Helicobacteraceae bacterium]|nr:hypothetical protein [Helicobacteraceae bacterium]